MNLGKENETIEFKKSTGELKEAMISISAMVNYSPLIEVGASCFYHHSQLHI